MFVTNLSSHDVDPKTYFYSIGFILAVLFALLDSNSSGLALPVLLVMWLLQSLVPVSVLLVCQHRLQQFRWLHHWSPWLKLTLTGVIASAIFAGPALLLDIAAGLDPMQHDWQSWCTAWMRETSAIAPLVTLGWIAANVPWVLGWRLVKTPLPPAPQDDIPPSYRPAAIELDHSFVGITRQLPDDKRGNILYMKSELHYLMVVTDKGRALILSSLKDAIADLPVELGFQPHRSYWVRRSAIKKLIRQGRQGQLVMLDDYRVPVSRQQLAQVSEQLQTRDGASPAPHTADM